MTHLSKFLDAIVVCFLYAISFRQRRVFICLCEVLLCVRRLFRWLCGRQLLHRVYPSSRIDRSKLRLLVVWPAGSSGVCPARHVSLVSTIRNQPHSGYFIVLFIKLAGIPLHVPYTGLDSARGKQSNAATFGSGDVRLVVSHCVSLLFDCSDGFVVRQGMLTAFVLCAIAVCVRHLSIGCFHQL